MHQYDIKFFSSGGGNHVLELGSPVGSGAFPGIDKFSDYLPSQTLSMVTTTLKLKRNGEVSFGLLFG
ncbi:MAG: hypothetical protein PHF12_02285 [Candidatus Omnitrophica bacterium]|nr:hypothetical protein [Candidatus Omnitrophota bacterium]